MVIRPSSPIEIGRIEKNPDKLQAVYELGAKDGNANLQKIKDFIKIKSEALYFSLLRNKLIAQAKYTEAVDELMIKIRK